jgi:hypothetical protein
MTLHRLKQLAGATGWRDTAGIKRSGRREPRLSERPAIEVWRLDGGFPRRHITADPMAATSSADDLPARKRAGQVPYSRQHPEVCPGVNAAAGRLRG